MDNTVVDLETLQALYENVSITTKTLESKLFYMVTKNNIITFFFANVFTLKEG